MNQTESATPSSTPRKAIPMKDYQKLDPKLFKAFMAAAETENFTSAASRAYMTQSGVSQQIAKLEDQIGLPLFKRIGKRVVLTETGRKLSRFVAEHHYFMDTFLDSVRDQHTTLSGLVSYAMPPSCLYAPQFNVLLQKRAEHPGIRLNVVLGTNRDVIHMVLEDRVDFGFITEEIAHPSLLQLPFGQEEYILVGSDPAQLEALTEHNLLDHDFITYPGASLYYDAWLRHHGRAYPKRNAFSLTIAGDIDTIEGALKMTAGGLGLCVFPRHCVATLLAEEQLFEYRGNTTQPPLLQTVSIVMVRDHIYPRRVQQVVDWLIEPHKAELSL